MSFKMRTTKPEKGNKYYTRKVNGGYSNAVQGYPVDNDCDVLSNCVGYAYGRFNEIGGWGCCKYLAPVNAENFIQYKGSCKTGIIPKVGACMVWQRGATLSGSDGAGHVAIVEKVISDTEVITSESGWGFSTPFWNATRKKGADGRWGADSQCKFLGFIYNPGVEDMPPIEKPVDQPYMVKVDVNTLNIRSGPSTNYSVVGTIRDRGVYTIVEEAQGTGARLWGKLKSGAGWISLDYVTKR